MDNTSISFPSGAIGPGFTPPFLVGSLLPGQGGMTGYGDINVAPMRLNARVRAVRSPIGPVHGYRDQTGPLGPATYIPANIPGPIYPGVGKGGWHVGPKVVHGALPYGTYGQRFWERDRTLHTYGAPANPFTSPTSDYVQLVKTGAISGAVVGLLTSVYFKETHRAPTFMLYGAAISSGVMLANELFWYGVAALGERKYGPAK